MHPIDFSLDGFVFDNSSTDIFIEHFVGKAQLFLVALARHAVFRNLFNEAGWEAKLTAQFANLGLGEVA